MNKHSAVKILIVDDQPLIVDELHEFLESSGYPCVACYSSRDAVARFVDDIEIGLVICDLAMPDLNGIQLVEELTRIAGKTRVFESIMLTGQAEKQDVIKALRAGIADYYQKPVNLTELLEGVQRQEMALLERHRSHQHLGHLNEKLKFLAASIDDIYQDLDKARRQPLLAPEVEVGNDLEQALEKVEMPAMFDQLSPRQLDVARLVGKGQTNYQIACELGITENTVKLYVSQVLRLTRMHNRTQLALALSPSTAAMRQRATAH
ncbi:response regulator transcription factor [Pseudomonas sp. NA-150]|uniref:response regulator transcription factor n=1 Tax=Pseudomonas sp. NA-150 TaxID=3367525 RepID=UPI0037C53F31